MERERKRIRVPEREMETAGKRAIRREIDIMTNREISRIRREREAVNAVWRGVE